MRSVVMLYLVQLLLKAEQINGSLNRLIKFDLWREVRSLALFGPHPLRRTSASRQHQTFVAGWLLTVADLTYVFLKLTLCQPAYCHRFIFSALSASTLEAAVW